MGAGQVLRWGAPPGTGKHDDLLVACALAVVLDGQPWIVPGGAIIIPRADPLEEGVGIDPNVGRDSCARRQQRRNNVEGIDISHWETVNDWPAVKKAGIRFVYLKATQGESMLIGVSTNTAWHARRSDCPGAPIISMTTATLHASAGCAFHRHRWLDARLRLKRHAAAGRRPGAIHHLAGW